MRQIITGEFATDLLGLAAALLAPYLKDVTETIDRAKERKKMEKVTMKKALNSPGVHVEVSEDMYDDIYDASEGSTLIEMDLISTAIRTNNWINYALYYMSNDDAVLLKTNRSCRELVNAISSLAGFGLIYTGTGIADLREYDIKDKYHKVGSKFLLNTEDIKEKLADPDFVQHMKLRKSKLEHEENNRKLLETSNKLKGFNYYTDEEGLLHPIFFSGTPTTFDIGDKQGNGIDNDIFARLERALKEPGLLRDEKYSYSRDSNGMINLVIQKENSYNATETFIIDDGRVMGGSTISILGNSVAANGAVGYLFVNVKEHPDIVYNILNHSFYTLTVDEGNAVLSRMLNVYAYTFVDFYNTPWFDYLNDFEKIELNKNLMIIIDYMQRDPRIGYLPRLRFSSYTNPSNFVLVSDTNTISPLKDIGITSPQICEGLSFTVDNGSIIQSFGNVPNMVTTTM